MIMQTRMTREFSNGCIGTDITKIQDKSAEAE